MDSDVHSKSVVVNSEVYSSSVVGEEGEVPEVVTKDSVGEEIVEACAAVRVGVGVSTVVTEADVVSNDVSAELVLAKAVVIEADVVDEDVSAVF